MAERFSIDLDSLTTVGKKPEGKPLRKRQRFEVRNHFDPITGLFRKDVFIDGKLFEWEVDEESWKKVMEAPPDFAQLARVDILRHFCVSLSELLGREVTPGQVVVATQTGWI